ncbi:MULTISPECIES: dsRBD fold-containing protein [unclassified Streptomyces]|uniref:dsRBD fold-containing protein n=1 Tax=unclassified Streptomyces TaxID=2593676 RepID=UPI0038132C27
MATTAEWDIHLYLSEEDGTTKARVELDTGTIALSGYGLARCNPQDVDVPVIGDELAAGRAMHDLGSKLMRVADNDMASAGAGPPERAPRAAYGWMNEMA